MPSALPGVSPTLLALCLVYLVSAVVFLLFCQAIRQPFLWQIGLRNILRRRGLTVSMIAGLALSSMFLTTFFGLSDSLNASQQSYRTLLSGTVDEAVTGPFTQDQVTQVLTRLRHLPEVEHVSAAIALPRSATIDLAGLAITGVDVLAVPADFDQVYGSISTSSGQTVHFGDLSSNEILLPPALAQRGVIHDGDTLRVTLNGQTFSPSVHAILAHDVVITTGELEFNGSYPTLIMPLITMQQIYQQAHQIPPLPDLICIKNIGPVGLDESQAGVSRSRTVNAFLEQFLHASSDPSGSIPTIYTDAIRLHPLKPDVVTHQDFFTTVAGKDEVGASPAARQFNYLLPIFTVLLIGASLLLLVLLVLLLAAERRSELGISRAIGMQRSHLVQVFVIECFGYGVLASLPGMLLGMGILALGLLALSHLPSLGLAQNISYQLQISWQSVLTVWCLSLLTIGGTACLTAFWISHDAIVAAISNLAKGPTPHPSLRSLLTALLIPPKDVIGFPLPETAARRHARQKGALWGVLREGLLRGPLLLLLAGIVFLFSQKQQGVVTDLDWRDVLPLLDITLLIAGSGLMLNWLFTSIHVPVLFARRLSLSLIGLGWFSYGLPHTSFLFAFEASWNRMPSFASNLLSMLVPLLGTVLLMVTNADLLALLLSKILERLPRLAPLSRIGLVYPLTSRFLTGVTVTMLGLVTFMVLLLVVNNESFLQQQQQTNGGFQLSLRVPNQQGLTGQLLQTPNTLQQDIASVGRLRRTYFARRADGQRTVLPLRALLPGQAPSIIGYTGPEIADRSFLTAISLPLLARARGYKDDTQIWQALHNQTGYALLYYQNTIPGLMPQQQFTPFQIDVPDGDTASAHYHRLTVIGLLPATSPWRSVLISAQSAQMFNWNFEGTMPWPWSDPIYYFRLQPEVDPLSAMRHLSLALHLGERGVQINRLDDADTASYTTRLTTLLTGYMALGFLFGTLSIGVITSRAVVERRQQIGMLRALGFSRGLILRAFLLESSFTITLGLATGSILVAWVLYQVSRQGAQSFPLPIPLILLLLSSCYLITGLCTVVPALRASQLLPAEALRYE